MAAAQAMAMDLPAPAGNAAAIRQLSDGDRERMLVSLMSALHGLAAAYLACAGRLQQRGPAATFHIGDDSDAVSDVCSLEDMYVGLDACAAALHEATDPPVVEEQKNKPTWQRLIRARALEVTSAKSTEEAREKTLEHPAPDVAVSEAALEARQEIDSVDNTSPAHTASVLWKVVGGVDTNGITVRARPDRSSQVHPEKLSTGAVVTQMERRGTRLRYALVTGTGPTEGWVTTVMSSEGKELLVPVGPAKHSVADVYEALDAFQPGLSAVAEELCGARQEAPEPKHRRWRVVNGNDGLIVRTQKELDAPMVPGRLLQGAVIRELDLAGERVFFEREAGEGPDSGWVSIRKKNGKQLLEPFQPTDELEDDDAAEKRAWEEARVKARGELVFMAEAMDDEGPTAAVPEVPPVDADSRGGLAKEAREQVERSSRRRRAEKTSPEAGVRKDQEEAERRKRDAAKAAARKAREQAQRREREAAEQAERQAAIRRAREDAERLEKEALDEAERQAHMSRKARQNAERLEREAVDEAERQEFRTIFELTANREAKEAAEHERVAKEEQAARLYREALERAETVEQLEKEAERRRRQAAACKAEEEAQLKREAERLKQEAAERKEAADRIRKAREEEERKAAEERRHREEARAAEERKVAEERRRREEEERRNAEEERIRLEVERDVRAEQQRLRQEAEQDAREAAEEERLRLEEERIRLELEREAREEEEERRLRQEEQRIRLELEREARAEAQRQARRPPDVEKNPQNDEDQARRLEIERMVKERAARRAKIMQQKVQVEAEAATASEKA